MEFTTVVIAKDGLLTQVFAQCRWSFKQVWLYIKESI